MKARRLQAAFAVVAVLAPGFCVSQSTAIFKNAAMERFTNLIMVPLGGAVTYHNYTGDGTTAQGWPAQSDWEDLGSMWYKNQQVLTQQICDNTHAENADLYRAITQVSGSTGVDSRFILAIIMEESRGCVRVQSTFYSVANNGLMQSYEGKGTCANPVRTPCPWSEILQMVEDGTAPNPSGEDLKELLTYANRTDVSMYYRAARMYNSGKFSIGSDGQLSAGGANACYASDIANRLVGYVGLSCGDSSS